MLLDLVHGWRACGCRRGGMRAGQLQEHNGRLEEQQAAMAAEVLQLQSTLATTNRLCALLQRDAARRNKVAAASSSEQVYSTVRHQACIDGATCTVVRAWATWHALHVRPLLSQRRADVKNWSEPAD